MTEAFDAIVIGAGAAGLMCALTAGQGGAKVLLLDHLDKDRAFLTRGGVFTNDMIDGYIALKMEEVTRFRMTTHPVEYDMYFSL